MNLKPKLVGFDLDGTLAESKQPVSVEVGELLAQLLAVMPVAIMSGAAFNQFEAQFLPALPENSHFERLYLFPTNAAQCFIYRAGNWQVKYDRSFNAFERGRILQALKEALSEVGMDDDSGRPEIWGKRIEDRGAQITFSALGQQAPLEEKARWDPKGDKRKPLREALLKRLPDFEVQINSSTSIDITQKGVNKAYGIRQLVQLSDVSVAEILYIGDALSEGGSDAVVISTGVHTKEVLGPSETISIIKDILRAARLG
jgi:HAD superfamily hydrolase (TIGR01484 family)